MVFQNPDNQIIASVVEEDVGFGPENISFEELRQAWRGRRMTLRAAAEACGIPKSTFRDAALRAEMAVNCAETK